MSFIVYVLQTPVHLAKFHILISTVHAKSACVGLLYKRKSSVVVYIRKNTHNFIAKQCGIHITHLRGRNQQLGFAVFPESFLFLIHAIPTLIGMDRCQKNFHI